MGKCTSCILYIKQNPTTYKEPTISQRNGTLIAVFPLGSSTTNQSIPNNIIYSLPPPFSKKKINYKKWWPCEAKNKLKKFRKSFQPMK